MEKPKILVFAGSTRTESYNKKLARIGAQAVRNAGGEATFLDLRDIPMPLYDGDLEENEDIPANGMKFRELLLAHRGLLISSPEYNSSIPGVLKNAIDWASRPREGEDSLICFKDKVAGLMAASPGGLGGLRGLVHLRAILGNINVLVIPDQIAIPKADQAFNPDGTLKEAKYQKAVDNIASKLTRLIQKLNS